ncbi:asparagine synthase (glutamine-hydrolyzing) [Fibrobacterota bacterium]
MCGICGGLGIVDRTTLEAMCREITHRGPDEDGFFIGPDVMLGMRRLNVIDLHTGSQPIYNEDKTVVVVYNGEIYNYRELRRDLKLKGHVFTTNSDTETIVHLYEEHGTEGVSHLRGMFAFALWDSNNQRLIIARDRIGIKPLYYYVNNGTMLFASEIKSLLKCRELSRELDYSALHDYLTFMYVPAPKTIFKNVHKLLPGHMLIHEDGKLTVKKYWDLDSNESGHEENNRYNEKEAAEKLLGLMSESVEKHLVSDVPLGVFLSGGTDSGTMVALASEVSSGPLKTFCIGFEESFYDEQQNARLVAERYRTDHHEFVVKPPDKEKVEEIIGYFDEPFADSSAIPTYFVSKCAKELVTVALSGDGGDELFGGYGNYKADKIVSYLRRLPKAMRNMVMAIISKIPGDSDNLAFKQQLHKLLATADLTGEHGHVSWLSVFSHDLKKTLYRNEDLTAQSVYDSLDQYGNYFDDRQGNDFINDCVKVDIKTVLPDDYLTKVDRMSMANSLEVRVPFLDHKLLEFSASLPSDMKLRGLTTKYLLKKVMRGRLPAEILYGRKKGFSVPMNKWLKDSFSGMIDDYLSRETINRRGYFSPDFIDTLTGEHRAGIRDHTKELWTLVCFEIWHRNYMN